jgi:hypothetical protein
MKKIKIEKIVKVISPIDLANDLVKNPDKFQMSYSNDRSSLKEFRNRMVELHNATEIMTNYLIEAKQDLSLFKDLDKQIEALKTIAEAKSLTETRVRFWTNTMTPVIASLAKKIKEINEQVK